MVAFEKLIGMPVSDACLVLKQNGYSVEIVKNSKQKISTDAELVVLAKEVKEKQVLLIVGEFLINIEGKDGLV